MRTKYGKIIMIILVALLFVGLVSAHGGFEKKYYSKEFSWKEYHNLMMGTMEDGSYGDFKYHKKDGFKGCFRS